MPRGGAEVPVLRELAERRCREAEITELPRSKSTFAASWRITGYPDAGPTVPCPRVTGDLKETEAGG
jgi:hypothetical protein